MVPDQSTALDPAQIRRWTSLGIIALGFLLCGVAGWLLAGRGDRTSLVATAGARVPADGEAPSARAANQPASPAARESSIFAREALQRDFQSLQSSHRAVSRQYEDLANWVLTNLRGRFLLKEQHVGKLRFAPVGDDYAINPELAEFLGINPGEDATLNDALQYSRVLLTSLQQQFLSATQMAPDRVTLYIPPFEREGAALREDLYGALQTVLGSDRFGRMLTVGEQDLIRAYDFFGTAARSMEFQLVRDPDNRSAPHLLIRDGWVIPKDASRRSIETTEEAVRELPARYHAFLAWLPDAITAYVKP